MKIDRFLVLVVSSVFILITNLMAAEQAVFYVAPSGSDANPGTKESPFKTMHKAQQAVRAINSSMTGDIVVYMREGTYQFANTLRFNNSDGGTNGHYVRYENYPEERPLITGGIPIQGWTLCDEAKDIWCVTGVDARFRQLYVNNKKAIRARYPNLGKNGEHEFFRLTKVDTLGKGFNIDSKYVSNWKNPKKVEIHLMIAWAESVLRLNKTTNYGSYTKFEPQDPERTMLFNRPYPMLGVAFMSDNKQQCFYLENAYEFIDSPGEWYLDETANILYYKPRSGEIMGTSLVVAPRLETLIEFKGTSTSKKMSHMSIKGLALAHTNFLRPSEQGFLNLQAGMFNVAAPGGNNYYLWRPAAGVTVENAHHMRFEKNLFSQMAATGLDFISGTNDDMIQGNVFADLGGAGVMIGKFSQDTLTEVHVAYNPADKEEISTRDTIKNNLVTHVTTEIQGAVGIGAGYPRHILIEHNELSYMNYSGISVGFGWTKAPNAMTDNKINWNEIHHVAQLLTDCGAIYTLSNQGKNSEIHYNYMHDISQSKWADYWILPIYLDEGSSGYDVSNNVSVNAPSGVATNQAGDFTQSNNNGKDPNTIAKAGIEAEFKWIKNNTILPLPNFSEMIPQAPFGEMMIIPGTIQLENYDEGGQSVSFSDKDFVNEGGEYRNDGVDIVAVPNGYAIGYTNAGEWLEYTVNVKEASIYYFRANASSGVGNASFQLFLDNIAITDTIIVPQGEDWDTYSFIDGKTKKELPAGKHVLKVAITGSYVNLDWILFAKDLLPSTIPSVHSSWNSAVSQNAALHIYNLQGAHLGSFSMSDGLTKELLISKMHSSNYKPGVYFVRSGNGSINKMIELKK